MNLSFGYFQVQPVECGGGSEGLPEAKGSYHRRHTPRLHKIHKIVNLM